jgi:peptidoglycan/LPS O-acetylase OafA/YrhL
MEIPAWLVSFMAFGAAIALWSVRPMPWRIRLGLIIPILSFGLLYFWVQAFPETSTERLNLIRGNLLLVFTSIILTSLAVYRRWRVEKKMGLHR